MSIEVKVPQLPESVQDATLVNWHKKPGDSVNRDENLVDIETDKVVLEVPAPVSGVLKEIRVKDGTTVGAGQVLAILEEGAGSGAAPAKTENKPAAAPQPQQQAAAAQPAQAPAATRESDGGDMPLSPSVRRLVEENKLDPSQIKGSARDGRLTKGDVLDYMANRGNAPAAAPAAAPSAPPAARPLSGRREDRRVPMTRMRARIAQRLSESQANTVMLTSFNEVDLSLVIALRTKYKDKFEKEHGVKLGFMSFFVKAAVEALKKYPVVNA